MTTPALHKELREFFERFDIGGADLFHEQFLSLDPARATVVTRDQLRAVLPKRAEMFGSVGASGNRLRDLDIRTLDDQHVLVETHWDVEFGDPNAEPLTLHATYLLRRAGDGWSVVVYLNHQDIAGILANRSQPADA
ncbi:SnoaL-like domain-containing protein [Actinopolymorpha cephalotaxi]|uniref:Ketosteroid isomerase-like protein n=1 Tax=Actinopolymorpha cephalotaxi TaxID=504797 RepID=A0A1I3B976_9ACTN|nr:nuclear transport factor 2 family protein [Actinopolymorpha cephalotaxi]NYH86819.1 ketosteroid isomerase-like protein [Actinopolymorpha cephalotaxi]SFH58853.1 SnoaL-like domain-containing protein [Actinopolymorpha cephalotaxi]